MVKKAGSVSKPKAKSAATETKPTKFKGRDFEEWKKRFEASLIVGTDAWKGFQRCIRAEETFASMAEVPWRDDCRGHALERIHGLTSSRPELEKTTLKKRHYTKKALRELHPKLESLASEIRGNGASIATGIINLDTSKLLKSLDCAAKHTRDFLELLDHPFPLQPKIIEQYMPLMCSTSSLTEKQVCALAFLAMKAHGYQDSDLTELHPTNLRNGTARKHLESIMKRGKAVINLDLEQAGKPKFFR